MILSMSSLINRIAGILASFKIKSTASFKVIFPSMATRLVLWVTMSPASLSSNSKMLVIISASLASSTPLFMAFIDHRHDLFLGYVIIIIGNIYTQSPENHP